MSHVTDLRLKIRDLDALAEAAERCGMELRKQPTYAWWGTYVGDSRSYGEHLPSEMGKCEYALRIKGDQPKNGSMGPWEIGVFKAKDGDGYGLAFDTFGTAGGRLLQAVEMNANKLRREYAAAAASGTARRTLARKGFSVLREELPGNRIRLRLRRR